MVEGVVSHQNSQQPVAQSTHTLEMTQYNDRSFSYVTGEEAIHQVRDRVESFLKMVGGRKNLAFVSLVCMSQSM